MVKRARIFISLLAAAALLAGLFAMPAAAAPAKKADTSAYAAEVLRLTNAERAGDGRRALAATHSALNAAARKRAEEIAVKYDSNHLRPDGRKWSTVFAEYGIAYQVAGENIAMGQTSPAAVVAAWMNSPGHRSNILGLDANFNCIGVGVCQKADGTLCWVQLFINDGAASANPGAGKLPSDTGLLLWDWALDTWNYIDGFFSMASSFFKS